jgi:hypothetical protein
MKTIIKIMGLPRTGTNLLNALVSLNFKNYVSNKNKWHFDVDYLGWKHDYCPDIKTIKLIEERTNEEILFLFLNRNFESWQEVMIRKHIDRAEFILKFQKNLDKDPIIYSTPSGPKMYYSLKHLYDDFNSSYLQFVKDNPEKSMLINYDDVIRNQEEIILSIKNKFKQLELTYDKPINILKEVNSEGQMVDFKS